MPSVSIQIIRYLSDDQPGFVAARLTDAFGKKHIFHDKVPIFTTEPIDRDAALPAIGWLDCEIVERFDDSGRELAWIDTEKPWDVQSTSGCYRFVVAGVSIVDY